MGDFGSQKTFEGLFASENTTGCKLPCELTTYPVKEYRIFDMEYFTDPAVQNFLTKNNYTKSSAIMINHQKPKELIQYEEVLEYDSSNFISDAGIKIQKFFIRLFPITKLLLFCKYFLGGTVGIFVGLSFWSVYETVCGPIFQWLEKKFLKCAQMEMTYREELNIGTSEMNTLLKCNNLPFNVVVTF